MRKLHDNNSGFTLIEVLIAMTILSIGLLGTAALITSVIRGNQVSNRVTTATTLAQDKMEDIKRLGYLNAVSEAKAFLQPPDDKYEREVIVTPNSPSNGMSAVTVKVYWESTKSISLQTILSR